MLISFLLFRAIAGDIASIHAGAKNSEQYRQEWRQRHGYDRPLMLNLHRMLMFEDKSAGRFPLDVKDVMDETRYSRTGDVLALVLSQTSNSVRVGRYVPWLSMDSGIQKLTDNKPLEGVREKKTDPEPNRAILKFILADGQTLEIDVTGSKTCGELIRRVNQAAQNRKPGTDQPLVEASISAWSLKDIFNAQFWPYLLNSATFQSRSLKDNKKLTEIIVERAPYSLAFTVPAMAIGWVAGMIISCVVAYYRGSLIDKIGVFLSVLGMCIPFLAFMIIGQWLMYEIAPEHAYGLTSGRGNIYVPVFIMVVAGLGGSVRFYRTVILNEVNQDYVRTARAKGTPLPTILFKHVLKNCMLPILTNLILSIPFLIMGSLLVESYFGISGLGDLLLTSFNDGDEPVLNGLVFLTALIYTIGLLITDLSYAVFDPRIRLR
jgi:peptide/nickel transport system permease protein